MMVLTILVADMLVLFLLCAWHVCTWRAIDVLTFSVPETCLCALLSGYGEASELQPGPLSLGAFKAFLAIR